MQVPMQCVQGVMRNPLLHFHLISPHIHLEGPSMDVS
jgi:hypothetical protein